MDGAGGDGGTGGLAEGGGRLTGTPLGRMSDVGAPPPALRRLMSVGEQAEDSAEGGGVRHYWSTSGPSSGDGVLGGRSSTAGFGSPRGNSGWGP